MISAADHCYNHPDRPASVGCQRCDRPICSSCMNSASVGYHCPSCAKSGAQKVYRGVAGFRHRPTLVYGIIAVNVVVFVAELLTGESGGINGGIAADGWLWGPIVAQNNEYYRIITSGFLHGNTLHLAMNMYGLYVLGPVVLQLFGKVRFLAIYFISLLGGSAGVLLFAWNKPTLGASGALLGLAGAIAGAFVASGRPLKEIPMLQVIGINLLLPLMVPVISFWGHFGGSVAGFAVGFVAQRFAQQRQLSPAMEYAAYAGIGLAFVGLAVFGAEAAIGFNT